jgi:hypothetical protein
MVTRGIRSMVIGPGGCRFSDSWRLGPLVCQALGPEEARDRLGANATGLAFNSLAAVERGPDGRTNPMVNAGAIATASLAPGASQGERWAFLRDGLWKTATATSACPSDFWTGGGWEPVYSDGSAARRWRTPGRARQAPRLPARAAWTQPRWAAQRRTTSYRPGWARGPMAAAACRNPGWPMAAWNAWGLV